MKKVITIILALILMMILVACNGKDKPQNESETTTQDTTTETVSNTASNSKESELLNEILATDTYLGLADKAYKYVVDYIQQEIPDETTDYLYRWHIDDEYSLRLNTLTRALTLEKGEYWRRVLCKNVDFPNCLSADICMTVINDCTYHESLDSIEVWQFGKELFEVELPSSEIEVVGILENDGTFETIIRSDSTISTIISKDGKFEYEEITSDCAGPIQMLYGSVWYVDMNANLIHINVLNKEFESIAQNVTSLVPVHDGTYSMAWREKGSLEWHEPEFCVLQNGEVIPWSEKGGM
ncbi:MAG: hypothetical protein IJB90_03675 [Clostridia bacterium]|nr:hypothetical protein [Clostridia bacterium]